jgi:cell division protein FtsW (lipid II flippase)
METVFNIALGVHILSILGILGLLLSQAQKSPRKLSPGIIHAGLLAFVAGIVMTSIWKQVNPDELLNHTKLGVKAIILVVILIFAYTNVKKDVVKNWIWATMLGLTVLNIIIAVSI